MASMYEQSSFASKEPKAQAPAEKCPYRPGSAVTSHPVQLAAPSAQAIFAGLVSHTAVFAQMQSLWRISRDRSRQKRGPPSQLLS